MKKSCWNVSKCKYWHYIFQYCRAFIKEAILQSQVRIPEAPYPKLFRLSLKISVQSLITWFNNFILKEDKVYAYPPAKFCPSNRFYESWTLPIRIFGSFRIYQFINPIPIFILKKLFLHFYISLNAKTYFVFNFTRLRPRDWKSPGISLSNGVTPVYSVLLLQEWKNSFNSPIGMMKATHRNWPLSALFTSYRKSWYVVPKCLKTNPNSASVRLKML